MMKKLIMVLGFIAAVVALILAVTPLSPLAFIPMIVAAACGGTALWLTTRSRTPQKSIYLMLLLTGIALVLSTYKAIFTTAEVADMEAFEEKEEASKEDSKEILETLDLEEFELEEDSSEIDTMEIENLPELDSLEQP